MMSIGKKVCGTFRDRKHWLEKDSDSYDDLQIVEGLVSMYKMSRK